MNFTVTPFDPSARRTTMRLRIAGECEGADGTPDTAFFLELVAGDEKVVDALREKLDDRHHNSLARFGIAKDMRELRAKRYKTTIDGVEGLVHEVDPRAYSFEPDRESGGFTVVYRVGESSRDDVTELYAFQSFGDRSVAIPLSELSRRALLGKAGEDAMISAFDRLESAYRCAESVVVDRVKRRLFELFFGGREAALMALANQIAAGQDPQAAAEALRRLAADNTAAAYAISLEAYGEDPDYRGE